MSSVMIWRSGLIRQQAYKTYLSKSVKQVRGSLLKGRQRLLLLRVLRHGTRSISCARIHACPARPSGLAAAHGHGQHAGRVPSGGAVGPAHTRAWEWRRCMAVLGLRQPVGRSSAVLLRKGMVPLDGVFLRQNLQSG